MIYLDAINITLQITRSLTKHYTSNNTFSY